MGHTVWHSMAHTVTWKIFDAHTCQTKRTGAWTASMHRLAQNLNFATEQAIRYYRTTTVFRSERESIEARHAKKMNDEPPDCKDI